MKLTGISLEIGRSDKWFWYLGRLKLLQVRPSHYKIGESWVPAKYGGLKFDLMLGKLRRPIPRFYRWSFFFNKDYVSHETEFNPWNSGNHWFVLTLSPLFTLLLANLLAWANVLFIIYPVWVVFLPFLLNMFMSVCYGAGERQPGFYIGMKTYEVNRISQNRKIYMADRNDIIRNDIAWGSESEKENIYLCPSASLRDDLVD